MDLIINSSDICRTRIFDGNNNELLYDIMTDRAIFSRAPTIVYRHHDGKKFEVGRIEWATWDQTAITCHEQQIHMESTGVFSHSRVYKALNGLSYKWKIDGEPVLKKADASKELVAVYSPKSSIFSRHNRPEMLKIAPEGTTILDELVVTFVYFEKKRRERRRRGRNAAIASSAGG